MAKQGWIQGFGQGWTRGGEEAEWCTCAGTRVVNVAIQTTYMVACGESSAVVAACRLRDLVLLTHLPWIQTTIVSFSSRNTMPKILGKPLSNLPPRILRRIFKGLPWTGRNPNPLVFQLGILYLTLVSLSIGKVRKSTDRDAREFRNKKINSSAGASQQIRPIKLYFRPTKPREREPNLNPERKRIRGWFLTMTVGITVPTRHWTLRVSTKAIRALSVDTCIRD